MHIETLRLIDFRNYAEEQVEFSPGVNILTGRNGEGKTNLVEAVYLLSMGRSFRTNADAQMLRFGQERFSVRGTFEKDGESLTVEVGMEGRRKIISVDGVERRKSADLLEQAYTVLFSPDDLRIVSDDPENRRRFMDRELFQIRPLYYLDVVKYRRVLRSRNLLLKERTPDGALLDIYDGYLAETGARIMTQRAHFALRLHEMSAEIQARITGGRERLVVSYEPNIPNVEAEADAILACLRERRAKDREAGTTTAGPHKDDLKILSDGVDLRAYGSRGQQRTAALSLKLAELSLIKDETGVPAILLLDDVLSELDEERQRFLIGAFEGHQILLTAAGLPDEIRHALPQSRILRVEGGRLIV
ncbi:MAG: DNA replication/repair protein RecF [Clostridiales Family XIII bacterium]|jgi:DNA replication and repair protein RecF|nr:DNA replication/repair protein RecF [Clostridiales Family XIII bacterium]